MCSNFSSCSYIANLRLAKNSLYFVNYMNEPAGYPLPSYHLFEYNLDSKVLTRLTNHVPWVGNSGEGLFAGKYQILDQGIIYVDGNDIYLYNFADHNKYQLPASYQTSLTPQTTQLDFNGIIQLNNGFVY